MNDFRIALVDLAFDILDKNDNGTIELADIEDVYNAKQHPDVKAGRKKEEDVLLEFLETFETHHNIVVIIVINHIYFRLKKNLME